MKTNFKPVVGNKFWFAFIAKEGGLYNGIVSCEVAEFEPYAKLLYTLDGHVTKDQVVFLNHSKTLARETKSQLIKKRKDAHL
jgi:hypothetical protein